MYKKLIISTYLIFSAPAFSFAEKEIVLNDDLVPSSSLAIDSDRVSDEELKAIAFENLKKELNQLTPEQLAELLEAKKRKVEAGKRMYPPKALNEIIEVSVAPGSKVERIYLSESLDTILSVIDANGNAWPIEYISTGNGEEFPYSKIEAGQLNKAKLNSLYRQGSTNLSLILKGLDPTVTIELVASKRRYHPQALIQIDQNGPLTKKKVNFSLGNVSFDDELENTVLGIKPNDKAKPLKADSPLVKAWLGADGELYLRTKLLPRSPRRPRGIRHGGNGFIAYKMQFLPVIIMSDDNGNEHHIVLKEEN